MSKIQAPLSKQELNMLSWSRPMSEIQAYPLSGPSPPATDLTPEMG